MAGSGIWSDIVPNTAHECNIVVCLGHRVLVVYQFTIELGLPKSSLTKLHSLYNTSSIFNAIIDRSENLAFNK